MKIGWGKSFNGVAGAASVRLLSELGSFRSHIVLIVVLGFVVSAVQPISVKLSQLTVDALQKGLATGLLNKLPLGLVLVFLVSGLAKYFHNTTRRYVAEKVIIKLRNDLFRKYLFLPLSVLDQKRTGEMLSAIQNDLGQISAGVDTLFNALKEPFVFLGLMGIAFYFDWQLATCTLLVAPFVIYLFSRSGALVKRYSTRTLEHFSDLLSVSQESIAGNRIVKTFQLEDVLIRKFGSIHHSYFRTVWKSIRVQEIPTPLVEFIGALLMATIILYGSYRISSAEMSTGELVAFIIAIGLIQMPIKQLNNVFLKLKAAEAAAERIYSTLDIPTSLIQRSGTKRKNSFTDRLDFKSVWLQYGQKTALRNISLGIKRGECVALVGQSGSGKSSLVNLLPRLFDPSEGSILIDGKDIRDILIDDLRGLVSFVTQDTFLFNDTIRENIRYGNVFATDRQVEDAASLAHCIEFVSHCAEGFDSKIGERGVCLSGGERQRLAIARAVLKGAPILVLDEATSNLDSESERIVQEALETLMKGKTTLLVAHRLSSIKLASHIYVLENGQICESGSHDDLLKQRGQYAQLFRRQSTSNVPSLLLSS